VLEPDEAKVSSPVLRGLAPSNGGGLLGTKEDLFPRSPFRASVRIADNPSRIGKEVSKTAVIRIGMLMLSHFRHARIQAIRRICSIIELIPMEQSGRGA